MWFAFAPFLKFTGTINGIEAQDQATATRFPPGSLSMTFTFLEVACMSLLLRAIISPARPERVETRSDPASTAKQNSFDPEPFSMVLATG